MTVFEKLKFWMFLVFTPVAIAVMPCYFLGFKIDQIILAVEFWVTLIGGVTAWCAINA